MLRRRFDGHSWSILVLCHIVSYCISLWECLMMFEDVLGCFRIFVEAPDIPNPGHMILHFCAMAVSYCIIYFPKQM